MSVCMCVCTMQCVLALVFIWTVDVYSVINNTIFVNLIFDIFVVIGFVRWRWAERKQQSTSANQRPFKVHSTYFKAKFYHFIILMFPRGCFNTFNLSLFRSQRHKQNYLFVN